MWHLPWEPGKCLISIQNSPGALFPLACCDSATLEGRNALCRSCKWVSFAFSSLAVSFWMLPLSQCICVPPRAGEPWDLTLHCFTCPKSHSQQASWICGQPQVVQVFGLFGQRSWKGRAAWPYAWWLYMNLLPRPFLLSTSALGGWKCIPKVKLYVL